MKTVPPLQNMSLPNQQRNKIKLLHHPNIKLQKKRPKIGTIDSVINKTRASDKNCVKVTHPAIATLTKKSKKKVYTESELIREDAVSCSDLASNFRESLSNLNEDKIESACPKTKDNTEKEQFPNVEHKAQNNEERNVKHKAFVVMGGNTKMQTMSNNIKNVIITNEDFDDKRLKKEAIVLSQVSNKIISKNDDAQKNNNNEGHEIMSTLMTDGKNEKNVVIKGNVVRQNVIERIVKKLESYSDGQRHSINRNPVCSSFSTYYKRPKTIGGTLLNTNEIATKYMSINVREHKEVNEEYISSMLQSNATNDAIDDNDDEEDEVVADTENNSNIRRSRRNQNHKKAKKFCAPSEELTRLQIREDIRKMRNPKVADMKMILTKVGLESYTNRKAYCFEEHNVNLDEDVQFIDDDANENEGEDEGKDMSKKQDDVQFIGMHSKRKKKKKKKRKRSYDYEQNSAFVMNGHPPMNGRKKQKTINHNSEAIKCRKCNKIFTLEVDLLLHKTNDHCTPK